MAEGACVLNRGSAAEEAELSFSKGVVAESGKEMEGRLNNKVAVQFVCE